MDLSSTTAPRSDQQNYDDYTSGPKTVTVAEVKEGSTEQPVEVHLVEFPGRPYKPSKSMRRVLSKAWGDNTDPYKGRQITLYGDPEVKFGKEKVGGIKISHLSHIPGPVSVLLTVARGRRTPFIVQPLTEPKDESGRDWLTELAAAKGDVDKIHALGLAARNANALPAVRDLLWKAYQEAKGVTV